MDKDILTKVATEAAETAVAKMREFHQEDLKVLGERMGIGFESVESKIEVIDQRLERVENALATLLREFKEEREKVEDLKRQVSELTLRVQTLEKQVLQTAS
jgi:archaellum component FlaC